MCARGFCLCPSSRCCSLPPSRPRSLFRMLPGRKTCWTWRRCSKKTLGLVSPAAVVAIVVSRPCAHLSCFCVEAWCCCDACLFIFFLLIAAFWPLAADIVLYHTGCQIILTKELDGMVLELPEFTRNFYVDGHVPQPH